MTEIKFGKYTWLGFDEYGWFSSAERYLAVGDVRIIKGIMFKVCAVHCKWFSCRDVRWAPVVGADSRESMLKFKANL